MFHATNEKFAIIVRTRVSLGTKSFVVFATHGGIADALKAIRTRTSDAEVQCNDCGALRNLASDPANQVRVATRGGIADALEAM